MSVRKGQTRLKLIAERLSQDAPLSVEHQTFLVKAFLEIANGADADVALGVKAKRGERKSHHSRQTVFNKQLFFGWVATAIARWGSRCIPQCSGCRGVGWGHHPSGRAATTHQTGGGQGSSKCLTQTQLK